MLENNITSNEEKLKYRQQYVEKIKKIFLLNFLRDNDMNFVVFQIKFKYLNYLNQTFFVIIK